MIRKSVLSWWVALAFVSGVWAIDDSPSIFSDSSMVLSQLNEKARGILRKGLRDQTVSRAKVVEFNLSEIKRAPSLYINTFDGQKLFYVVNRDTADITEPYKFYLKDAFGRLAFLVVTKKGITAAVYPAPGYGSYVYKIIPVGQKHLLMEMTQRHIILDRTDSSRVYRNNMGTDKKGAAQ